MADRISVVVISRNEGDEIKRTVENFDRTLPAGGEIIVVDDGSTDGSANQVKTRAGRIKLHRVKNYGVARARNAGARQARGGVIVYADAHLRLEPDWWRPMLEILANPRVGGVAPGITGFRSGRIGYGLTFEDSQLEVRWLRRKPRGPVAAPIIPGCCFATRRDVIEATGGWDERHLQRGNIDREGSVRLWTLGYELMIAPDRCSAFSANRR
jgi:glycosyltransferase involved in cell wall biosynthesis